MHNLSGSLLGVCVFTWILGIELRLCHECVYPQIHLTGLGGLILQVQLIKQLG